MHQRRQKAAVALLVWAVHLVLGVWHGVSGDHRSCAPMGQISSVAQTGHGCVADDLLGAGLPAADAVETAQPAPTPPPALPATAAAPTPVTDVLAFAPKASPPALT